MNSLRVRLRFSEVVSGAMPSEGASVIPGWSGFHFDGPEASVID